jgi:hypothetical protein
VAFPFKVETGCVDFGGHCTEILLEFWRTRGLGQDFRAMTCDGLYAFDFFLLLVAQLNRRQFEGRFRGAEVWLCQAHFMIIVDSFKVVLSYRTNLKSFSIICFLTFVRTGGRKSRWNFVARGSRDSYTIHDTVNRTKGGIYQRILNVL